MKINYRPEIDGLRAIAVISVILYHAKLSIYDFQPFQSGFLGVDIFFVISGYLITKILLKELDTTNKISLINFYKRRARRILPILFTVLLVSFPFAWISLLPDGFVVYAKTILSSLAFSSNFYFAYSGRAYGVETNLFLPFIHTWSLSVEEQFYIFFPLILIAAYKFKCLRKFLFTFLTIFFLLSLCLALWYNVMNPITTFYYPHTRIWELLAGSIIARLEMQSNSFQKIRNISQTFPIVGIILIGYSLLHNSQEMHHPSIHTLIPIIGSALIIAFARQGEFITKLLSSKPLVNIGLISYSLYLWHYPIFVFGRIRQDIPTTFDKIGWIALTIILAIASYFLIEKPFRNKKKINDKTLTISLLTLLGAVISLNLYVINTKGIPTRIPKELIPANLRDTFESKECHHNFSIKSEFCVFNPGKQKMAYLVGDSHIYEIANDLTNKLSNYHYTTTTMTSPANFFASPHNIDYQEKRLNTLLPAQNSIIIIGGYYQTYQLSDKGFDSFKAQFKTNIIKFIKNNNHVILIYPIPSFTQKVPRSIFIRSGFHKNPGRYPIIKKDYYIYKSRTQRFFDFFDSLSNKNIHKIYPHEIFCDESKSECYGNNKNVSFYIDDNHLSLHGADMINKVIMQTVEVIETK